jgi:hypothetical protein
MDTDYTFEYMLEHSDTNHTPPSDTINKKNNYKTYTQGHYIQLVQNEIKTQKMSRFCVSNSKKNENNYNKICKCIIS